MIEHLLKSKQFQELIADLILNSDVDVKADVDGDIDADIGVGNAHAPTKTFNAGTNISIGTNANDMPNANANTANATADISTKYNPYHDRLGRFTSGDSSANAGGTANADRGGGINTGDSSANANTTATATVNRAENVSAKTKRMYAKQISKWQGNDNAIDKKDLRWVGSRAIHDMINYNKSGILISRGNKLIAVGTIEKYGKGIMKVPWLASNEKGHGRMSMQELCKIAAEHKSSLTLYALEDARPFYKAIGMNKTSSNSYFFTNKQTQQFAQLGRVSKKSISAEPDSGIFAVVDTEWKAYKGSAKSASNANANAVLSANANANAVLSANANANAKVSIGTDAVLDRVLGGVPFKLLAPPLALFDPSAHATFPKTFSTDTKVSTNIKANIKANVNTDCRGDTQKFAENSKVEMLGLSKIFLKYNEHHDRLGRFASGGSSLADISPATNISDDDFRKFKRAEDILNVDIFSKDNFGNKEFSQEGLSKVLVKNKDFVKYATNYYKENYVVSEQPKTDLEKTKGAVHHLIRTWADNSGDEHAPSIAIQIAAHELFKAGTLDHLDTSLGYFVNKKFVDARALYNDNKKAFNAFLKAQYQATQQYLKDNKIDEILLVRGVGKSGSIIDDSKRSPEGTVYQIHDGRVAGTKEIKLQPMSSFSTEPATARSFGANFLYVKVKAKNILAMPNTGYGCTNENEVVIISKSKPQTVLSVPYKRDNRLSTNEHMEVPPYGVLATDELKNIYARMGTNIKSAKPEQSVPNIDEDKMNADWPKRTWDLDFEYGSDEFYRWLKETHTTLEEFKKRPIYKYQVAQGNIIEGKMINKNIMDTKDTEKRFISFVDEKEAQFSKVMSKYFKDQKETVLKSLNKKSNDFIIEKASGNPYANWSFPNRPSWTERLATEGQAFIEEVYADYGPTIYDELSTSVGRLEGMFNVESAGLKKYFKDYSFKFANGVMDTSIGDIETTVGNIVKNGMKAGWSVDKIAGLISKKISTKFDRWTDSRSKLIARTETIRASNGAAIEAYDQSGVIQGIKWLTTKDDLSCPTCAKMNGKIIKLDGTFFEPDDYSDGDSPPLHPNCRCTVVPIVADKYRLDYEPDVLKLGLVSILKRRGNFNHAGIPGHRGGSKPRGSSSSDQAHQQAVRERTTGLKKLSPKALRAVRSYVATRKGVQNTAVQNEKMLAEFLKGEHKGGRQPFDIKKGKHYIEVKTKIEGKIDKITIKGEAITKKDKLIKATKGSIGHTVVFDTRTNTIYYKKGYGSFWLTTMTKVKNMNGLKKYFK